MSLIDNINNHTLSTNSFIITISRIIIIYSIIRSISIMIMIIRRNNNKTVTFRVP